ncbi:steroidogenic acute regulatory protein, mitochondrial [Rhincodon typus]|uniref:steroidogenic acute regulatory protein, mitochondrial n=1 Tax=Rhincodon typus TaxID=259920 RepID=UPI00202F88DB|nr:steroidogenic acute regulatory protein, mitochondrial [Rhincodon typus]
MVLCVEKATGLPNIDIETNDELDFSFEKAKIKTCQTEICEQATAWDCYFARQETEVDDFTINQNFGTRQGEYMGTLHRLLIFRKDQQKVKNLWHDLGTLISQLGTWLTDDWLCCLSITADRGPVAWPDGGCSPGVSALTGTPAAGSALGLQVPVYSASLPACRPAGHLVGAGGRSSCREAAWPARGSGQDRSPTAAFAACPLVETPLSAGGMNYRAVADTVAEKLLGYSRDDTGWRVCKRTNEVCVSWRPSSEYSGNLYKGEGIIKAAPKDVWECLKPVPEGPRVKWDKNVKSFELIEMINDGLSGHLQTVSVCRTVTPSAAVGLISPRDFVDVILIKQYENGTISSNATHVEHPNCPPKPHYVRGFNHPCGCFCAPIAGEPLKTHLTMFFQTDLGGYLPQSVLESFFPSSMVEFYSNLAKAVKIFKA